MKKGLIKKRDKIAKTLVKAMTRNYNKDLLLEDLKSIINSYLEGKMDWGAIGMHWECLTLDIPVHGSLWTKQYVAFREDLVTEKIIAPIIISVLEKISDIYNVDHEFIPLPRKKKT